MELQGVSSGHPTADHGGPDWNGTRWSAHAIVRSSATMAEMDLATLPRLAAALLLAETEGVELDGHEVELLVQAIHGDLVAEGFMSSDAEVVRSSNKRAARVPLSGFGTGPLKSVELSCRVCGSRVRRKLADPYKAAETALNAGNMTIMVGNR